MERSEHVALVALLQSRPEGLTWAEIMADVVACGSAVETCQRLVPAALFADPSADPLGVASRDIETWTATGLTLLTVLDAEYPQRLRGIHQAPPVLFSRGKILADDPAVSVVGSRTASERGLTVAANIADALVSEGITAVAGLAAGIDAAVHRAALDAGGRTVAVIGTGINRYYPATNRDLQDEISERGLLLSQFWPDAPPQKHTFLMRNATMSGYGLATVVVEAGEKSGTRVQARMAVEHGRTVILTESVYAQNEWARNHLSTRGLITPDRVEILAYAVENHQSHWVMRGYRAPTPVREHLTVVRMTAFLSLYLHLQCLNTITGFPVTHWATVPSLPAKPGEHQLHSIVSELAGDLLEAPLWQQGVHKEVPCSRLRPDQMSVDQRRLPEILTIRHPHEHLTSTSLNHRSATTNQLPDHRPQTG